MTDRARCISPQHRLSVRRQCELLQVPRSLYYYAPRAEKPENLQMMRQMDPHLLEHPSEGVASMVFWLRERGYAVGPKRVRRLLRCMGHHAVHPKRNISKLGKAIHKRPYLLRDLPITRANQVWCTDITYVPMAKGSMYLTAVMDVYSRRILSHGISNTMDAPWCLRVLKKAVERYGAPEIINSDQGSQYTSELWTKYIEEDLKIRISMDGKGRATDNAWIERFWRTIKWEWLYLNPCGNGMELQSQVETFVDYYNHRHHQRLGQSPDQCYRQSTCLGLAS